MLNKMLPGAVFAAFFLLWHSASTLEWVSPVLLPSPLDIGLYLYGALLDGTILSALRTTLGRLLAGYGIGCFLGLGLGALLAISLLARRTLGLVAMGLQTLPSVCWAPLSILWFGQSESAMYFVVSMGSLWAVAIAAEQGLRAVPPLYTRAAQVMGSSGFHLWRTVVVPAALPHLLGGIQLGWAFAWRSLMAAEIYVTIMEHMGLGQLLHFGRELHAMDQAMGIMALIVCVGCAADRLVFMPAQAWLRRSRGLG